MVDFTEETSRKNIIIKKVEYTIAQPFAEGHVCTANEANALNQLLSENVRNNFAPKVEKSEVAPTQEDLDNYVASYQFGVRSVSSSDPVEKVMRQLVERKLIEALKARGKNKSSLSSEEFKNAIDAAVEKNRDVLYAKAKEIVMMQTAEIDLAL
jgi:hypothetical protein